MSAIGKKNAVKRSKSRKFLVETVQLCARYFYIYIKIEILDPIKGRKEKDKSRKTTL